MEARSRDIHQISKQSQKEGKPNQHQETRHSSKTSKKEQSSLQQSQDEHAEFEGKALGTRRRDIPQKREVLEPGSETVTKNENETRSRDIRQKLAEIEPGDETS